MGRKELKAARNVRPSFKYGLKLGTILTGIDQIFLRGKAPWTFKHGEPTIFTSRKNKAKKIDTLNQMVKYHLIDLLMFLFLLLITKKINQFTKNF